MECGVEEAVPNPYASKRIGRTLILACKPEAPNKEECIDVFGLQLITESSDATSALQEMAFLETLSEELQQN